LAADLHVADRLNLWGYDGGWHLADGMSLDATDQRISGQLSGVTYFAVAESTHPTAPATGTPEPACLLAFVGAGLLLARRRTRIR